MRQEGYIALISTILITSLLLVLTAAISFSGFFARYNILNSEYRERSLGIAEGCAETALLKVASDPTYTGDETITVDGQDCLVRPVLMDAPLAGQTTIQTQAIVKRSYSNIELVIDSTDYDLVSWDEVPNF